ncbi:tRNA lysidine(34) synthetase TilS [Ferrimonas balearica]|uniref:tRNA lysidine(34) synthetase TilS n=1 Tax=Ferrimonas balearica TaxID=44012 RepID=UPI001C99FDA4|nr:tRNA lysidine(34) synthetase TilS [Ferrimonas balearica]MBY5990674.1 tRNA lysidine(34) synthetase TilS [Ferrimonas balearica]
MPLSDALARLQAALAQALEGATPPRRLLVAYSGGVDSQLLVHCLASGSGSAVSAPIQLIHVHHGLSAQADRWAEHCQTQAEALGLPLEVVRVQPKQGPRISLEASAREARYQALAARCQTGDWLLTAHHRDDQVETLLLALKRGSGPLGLSGMAERQPFASGSLVRPWLRQSRAQIEAAAASLGLAHIEDDSNADERFDRNFLRRSALPLLNTRWPGFSQSVARSAALCAEQQQLVDELAGEDLAHHRQEDGALSVRALAQMSAPRRNNLVRFWLRQQGAQLPSQAQMGAMAMLWQAREDAQPQLDWGEHSLRRFRDGLYLVAPLPGLGERCETLVLGQATTLANGECWRLVEQSSGPRIMAPAPGQSVQVRYDLPGSLRLHPAGRDRARSLKKLWQEWGIPPWRRGQVALLCYDDKVVSALGLWLERSALCDTGPGWVPIKEND